MAKTETEVTAKVRALEQQRDQGRVNQPGKAPTVKEWMRTWLDVIAPQSASESTLDSTYRPKVENWIIPRLGRHRLDRLQPEHLDAFYKDLRDAGLKTKTILMIHQILSRSLKMAVQRRRVAVKRGGPDRFTEAS